MTALRRLSLPFVLPRERYRYGGAGQAAAAIVVLGLIASAPYIVSEATLNDLGQAVILGLLAISFNIVFKYSGLLSFGHAAFFGFAAYGGALLLRSHPGLPVLAVVALVGVISGVLGFVLGEICVRRSGAYFSMTTLAVGALIYTIAFKWHALTGGTDGLSSFMPPGLVIFPHWTISNPSITQTYLLVVSCLLPVALASWALLELTPFGNALRLVQQNEERAAFLGYDPHRIKLTNYVLAAFLAGVAGSLWAIQNGFVSTDSIDLDLSTTIIIMTFIGGSTWFWGPLLGSAVYVFGSDQLSALTDHWQLWMGVVFVTLVLACPQGIAGIAGALVSRVVGRRNA